MSVDINLALTIAVSIAIAVVALVPLPHILIFVAEAARALAVTCAVVLPVGALLWYFRDVVLVQDLALYAFAFIMASIFAWTLFLMASAVMGGVWRVCRAMFGRWGRTRQTDDSLIEK